MRSDSASAADASSRGKRIAARLALALAALVVWGVTWASIVLPDQVGRAVGATRSDRPRAAASFEPDLPPAIVIGVAPSGSPSAQPSPSPSATPTARPSASPTPAPSATAVAARTPTPAASASAGPTVTVAASVGSSGAWFTEEDVRVTQPGTLTALTVTVVARKTGGVSFGGQWDNVGSPISESHSSSSSTVTCTFQLGTGQTLGGGTTRIFAVLLNGSGETHPTSGDTYTVTYTVGGLTGTRSGHF